ncbi:hypothetical protein EDEG_02356 [Edhazardia aedis USNM 41457]|uniref:Uncharacterized protein n=1 Tax=Edhazardia aedis (strain USNM 41457) TaxID=1003232 RepID=J9DL15_EDHAE|nr:hypothetical protein EDEG_02356 [Edhazardia aedis USNM 41457]|eukprot:EJW03290.1 hypothetical protein EDEG_02356 [Edhazardia aedis USNM 41457]
MKCFKSSMKVKSIKKMENRKFVKTSFFAKCKKKASFLVDKKFFVMFFSRWVMLRSFLCRLSGNFCKKQKNATSFSKNVENDKKLQKKLKSSQELNNSKEEGNHSFILNDAIEKEVNISNDLIKESKTENIYYHKIKKNNISEDLIKDENRSNEIINNDNIYNDIIKESKTENIYNDIIKKIIYLMI